MYTEIKKIIEGGMSGDKEKVYRYSCLLAENLEKSGESNAAKQIKNVLNSKKGTLASLDSLAARPVDSESRMDIVDISYPVLSKEQIVLKNHLQDEIEAFIKSYQMKDELIKAGVEPSFSLLLYGPPGCGKTTIANYISSSTGLPLITARFDGLVSSYLGSTAKNIRKVFDYASRNECILFLDEFDAIAKVRDDKNELGELKRVVNSLIQNMDSFDKNSILIAATNHQQLLDPAIWRRFTNTIAIEYPKNEEIVNLLELYLMEVPNDFMTSNKRKNTIASAFINLSHGEIKTIINNANRNRVIQCKDELKDLDLLKEIYLHKHKTMEDEDDFIGYLLNHEIPQMSIHNYGLPLRKIREISKNKEMKL